MKTRIAFFLLAILIAYSANDASAQIKSILKDKAKGAIAKGLKRGEEDKNAQQADQNQQAQQEEQQQPRQQGQPNPMGNFMQNKMMGMMGMNNVKYDMNYSYTSSMSMEMEGTDSLGKKWDKVLYTTYFDKVSKSFAMEFEAKDPETQQKQKSLMIFDYKNWAMLILADKGSEKSGIAMQLTPDSAIIEQQNKPEAAPQKQEDISALNMYYKPTGRTKSIAGYKCKEYVYETPQGKAEVWATNDVVYDYSNAYGYMGGMQLLAAGGSAYALGTVMEMHFSDKSSKATSDFVVTDIKASNPKSVNLSGYQIIGMGGNPSQNRK
jgi:hypothetical protein